MTAILPFYPFNPLGLRAGKVCFNFCINYLVVEESIHDEVNFVSKNIDIINHIYSHLLKYGGLLQLLVDEQGLSGQGSPPASQQQHRVNNLLSSALQDRLKQLIHLRHRDLIKDMLG